VKGRSIPKAKQPALGWLQLADSNPEHTSNFLFVANNELEKAF